MQGAKVSLYFAERALLSLHPCSKRCKRWPSNPSFRNPVRRLGTEPHWGPALRPELRHLHAHERSAGPSQSRVSRSDALSRSGTVLKFCQCQAVELRKPRLRNAADVESRPGRDCRPGSGCISSLPFTLLAHKRSTGSDSGRRRVEKMPCNATYNGVAKACQPECAGPDSARPKLAGHWQVRLETLHRGPRNFGVPDSDASRGPGRRGDSDGMDYLALQRFAARRTVDAEFRRHAIPPPHFSLREVAKTHRPLLGVKS